MVLTFKTKKQDGTLTLHTNNNLIKDYTHILENVVNKFFLNDEKDDRFVIVNYTHKFNFIVVTIKHKDENILTYFKKLQARRNLEELFWEHEDCKEKIMYKKYKDEDELRLIIAKKKEILSKRDAIKDEFPNVYAEFKKELKERFAI